MMKAFALALTVGLFFMHDAFAGDLGVPPLREPLAPAQLRPSLSRPSLMSGQGVPVHEEPSASGSEATRTPGARPSYSVGQPAPPTGTAEDDLARMYGVPSQPTGPGGVVSPYGPGDDVLAPETFGAAALAPPSVDNGLAPETFGAAALAPGFANPAIAPGVVGSAGAPGVAGAAGAPRTLGAAVAPGAFVRRAPAPDEVARDVVLGIPPGGAFGTRAAGDAPGAAGLRRNPRDSQNAQNSQNVKNAQTPQNAQNPFSPNEPGDDADTQADSTSDDMLGKGLFDHAAPFVQIGRAAGPPDADWILRYRPANASGSRVEWEYMRGALRSGVNAIKSLIGD